MADNLAPITLTRKVEDIHSGGFSMEEEKALGFAEGELFKIPQALPELITLHKKYFCRNMELYKEKILENNGEYKEIKKDVYLHTSILVSSNTEFNTEKGVIVIEKDAKIMPFSYLVGPLRIDEGATVNPHSYISNSYIGKHSKVGGEVGGSVMEAYSNKSHYGGIFDSYIGSWVNLGGGTSNSNLKNTYGPVKMAGVETKELFLGAIISDHVKTAINTSIYTGKIIGIGAHIYGTVTEDVPSFTNYINKDKMTTIPLDVILKTAVRMFLRRHETEFPEEDKKVLSYAYTETESERKERGVKEGKLTF